MKQGHQQIQTLMADLSKHLERAGVSERAYLMPTGDLSQIKPDSQIKAFDFVTEILDSPEYEAVIAARDLVSEERWADYELYEFTGMQEQVIYAAALENLKTLWNTNRPSYWGKHYRSREEEFGDDD